MILAGGELRPDTDLGAILDGLEARIIRTRCAPELSPETVVEAIAALGERLARGELDDLIARYAPAGAGESLELARTLLSRQALEEKLRVELGWELSGGAQRPFGGVLVRPLGTLLHVGAGNVDGLPAFSAVEGLSYLDCAFEVASAMATVGLTAGVTTLLSPFSQALLIVLMYLGRVGILSFSIAFITRARRPAKIRYPEMNVMIG